MKPISYELNGFPEFLRSETACQKAVERGLLKADTPVVAYGDNGLRERMLASEHPLLAPLFAKDEPAPAAPPSEPEPVTPAPAAPPAAHAAEPVPAPAPASPQADPAPPPAEPVVQDAPVPPGPGPYQPNSGGASKAFWGIGALLVLGIAISQFGGSDQSDSTLPDAAAASDAASEAAQEVTETFHAVRELAVRSAPSANSSRITLLPRETVLTGVQVPSQSEAGYFWLRITEGQYAGNFVSMVNLSPEPRPSLNTSQAGFWYTTEALTPLEAPDDSARPKSDSAWNLGAGTRVEVGGVTGAGIFSSGWAEVMLDKQAGVGYVPLDRLTRESPAAMAAADAAADAAAAAADYAAADSVPSKGLRLESKCRNLLTLLVRYDSPSGWESVTVFLDPWEKELITSGGDPIRVVSSEVYFMTLPRGSGTVYATGTGNQAQFGGRSYRLNKVNIGTGTTEYNANFTCD